MRKLDAARLAGFLDGEGSVGLRVGRPRQGYISAVNTVRAELEWCQRVTTAGHINPIRRTNPKAAAWKPSWLWRVNTRADVVAILKAILPYLITKRSATLRVLAAFQSV